MTLHYEIDWSCAHCPAVGRQYSTGYDWDPVAILDGAIAEHKAISPGCDAEHGDNGIALKAPKVHSDRSPA